MSKKPLHRILIARPDRIGDVVLSTPVIRVLHDQLLGVDLDFMIRTSARSFFYDLPARLWSVDDEKYRGLKGMYVFWRELRRSHFDAVVHLQLSPRLAWLTWLARIPIRIGPKSHWVSYLFLNRGMRQKRSQVKQHEAEYNLDLLRPLGVQPPEHPARLRTQVSIDPQVSERAKEWLSEQGWVETRPLVCIHPGMGGSALNWPLTRYLEVAQDALARGDQVCFTFGPMDRELIPKVRAGLGRFADSVIYYHLDESADFLVGVFQKADLVVAPSTGPLHLAVGLGKSVVTPFPPILVQSEKRWGPFPREAHHKVLTPDVECPAKFECLREKCEYFPCMDRIQARGVLALLSK